LTHNPAYLNLEIFYLPLMKYGENIGFMLGKLKKYTSDFTFQDFLYLKTWFEQEKNVRLSCAVVRLNLCHAYNLSLARKLKFWHVWVNLGQLDAPHTQSFDKIFVSSSCHTNFWFSTHTDCKMCANIVDNIKKVSASDLLS
jgi:hypothetical protein